VSGSGLTLDHVGVAVRDLVQAHEVYSRLGFNLTDLSIHSGQPNADGKVQALGSGNHCAMFRCGYLELIGVVDPSKPSSVGPFLKSRHGGFIAALGCEDAEAAYAAAAPAFPTTQRPVALEREVDGPDGGTAMARFRNVLLGAAFPEARLLLIQHLTRDVIWREPDMVHPNGAVALVGAQFLVQDPEEAGGRYARLTGGTPERRPHGSALRLDGQEIQFIGADAVAENGPDRPHCPSLLGAALSVADIDATARLLTDNDIAFSTTDKGDLGVAPDQACGFGLTFTRSDTLS
jgi:glyoxalase-like protein